MKLFHKTQQSKPTAPQVYPSGICVKTEAGTYLIHKDGKRYKITSNEIEKSWAFPRIVETTEVAVSNYKVAYRKLGFRDGSLLYNIADGKIYLVSDSKLFHVVGTQALARLGAKFDDAMVVSNADIKLMSIGGEIA